jgi:hypothetical protein
LGRKPEEMIVYTHILRVQMTCSQGRPHDPFLGTAKERSAIRRFFPPQASISPVHSPCARVPQKHNGASTSVPTLPNVRTLRFLAHGVQVQLPQTVPQFLEPSVRAPWGRHMEPVRTPPLRHRTADFGNDRRPGFRGGHRYCVQ